MDKKELDIKNIFFQKRLWIVIVVFLLLAVLTWGADLAFANNYQDKFLPNVEIAGIDIGNLNMEEARAKLDKRIDFMNRRGFVYISPLKTVTISPSASGLESAESLSLVVFWDIDKSLAKVTAWQKQASLFAKLQRFFAKKYFAVHYNWNREEHAKILHDSFSDVLEDKQEASFSFVDADILDIVDEKAGQTFDYDRALQDTQNQIEDLISTDIQLTIVEDRPLITAQVLKEHEQEILSFAKRGDLYLVFENKDWNVPNSTWRNWLKLKQGLGKYYVGINQEKFEKYLEDSGIAEVVNVPVQDARFSLENGRVAEFKSSQAGRTIQIEETLQKLEEIVNQAGELEIALSVETVQPTIHNDEVNDLGITEIIGTGESDFSGSPVNRVHNINVGADTLHGILIKPDEEFSLIEALGDIDAEAGYRQELVIKGDKTIPEYGGGLCQIGTTVFRATLASGLPVTQRRNHSYRVSYYEPAGTDATIYDPWPDYRFKNDTGHYVLIQARIEGTKLYFDFWGTEDGRVAMTTQPEIYNIVAPPPTKIIKTTEIPVGTKKCTERAHNGADAKFDYSVQYANQPEPVETTFYSHYVPWQEVCLLGVTEEELQAEQEAQNNSSSTPVLEE